jgi:diaminopimelate epimerase
MSLSFSKYSGCGNDFILIDNRLLHFLHSDRAFIAKLCHRQRGIGADGVILLENSQKADYRMRIFNADGGEAEMCGNGIRCLMQFIRQLGGLEKGYLIETMNALLQVQERKGLVTVAMADPFAIEWELHLPCFLPMTRLNTGVPHVVLFVEDLESEKWMRLAPQIRFHAAFGPAGTNVNFAQLNSEGELSLRTYERGVEGETLACGTGATATALAAAKKYGLSTPVRILPASLEPLEISFSWQGKLPTQVTLTGPAHFI